MFFSYQWNIEKWIEGSFHTDIETLPSADYKNLENNDFISFDHCDFPSGLVEYPINFYLPHFYSVCFLILLKWENSLYFLIFEIMVQSILRGSNQLTRAW